MIDVCAVKAATKNGIPDRKKRKAILGISYCPVEVAEAQNVIKKREGRKQKKSWCFAIHASEINPPENEMGIEWTLLTNIEIHCCPA